MPGIEWTLADHGQGAGRARLLETDGQHVAVESTLPFAAGAGAGAGVAVNATGAFWPATH